MIYYSLLSAKIYVYPYTKTLEHHGLVAGFGHTLGFADIIDNALGGISCERKVSCGQLVTAMTLNGMGFTGSTCIVNILKTSR